MVYVTTTGTIQGSRTPRRRRREVPGLEPAVEMIEEQRRKGVTVDRPQDDRGLRTGESLRRTERHRKDTSCFAEAHE